MLYNYLKIIHVISAAVLFGTGLGTAFYMYLANKSKDITLIVTATKNVVKADWLFTTTSGFIQAITGFWMVYLHGYSLHLLWVQGSIIGYFIAAVCWFPVVYFQIKLRDLATIALTTNTALTKEYDFYYRFWITLGWPAFISLLVVFYFMSVKPL